MKRGIHVGLSKSFFALTLLTYLYVHLKINKKRRKIDIWSNPIQTQINSFLIFNFLRSLFSRILLRLFWEKMLSLRALKPNKPFSVCLFLCFVSLFCCLFVCLFVCLRHDWKNDRWLGKQAKRQLSNFSCTNVAFFRSPRLFGMEKSKHKNFLTQQ